MTEAITPRRAETQTRLLAAAISVFAEKGVVGAAVEEICERAGFTRGAFYSNFASKDELVLGLLNQDWALTTANVKHLTSDSVKSSVGGSVEQMLQSALAHFMNAQTTGRQWILVSAEIKLYAAREPSIRPAYLEFRDTYRRQTKAALQHVLDDYGAVLSMPIEQVIQVMTPVYESCMLNALLHLPASEDADVMQLDPATLAEVLAPLLVLLRGCILGFDGVPGSAEV